jgi:hypothetical protein
VQYAPGRQPRAALQSHIFAGVFLKNGDTGPNLGQAVAYLFCILMFSHMKGAMNLLWQKSKN